MKASNFAFGVLLLAAVAPVYAGSGPDRTSGPCFRVTIQNDRVNESRVRQNCDRNYSRTVQAGARNRATTVQTGDVNDNKVRQYDYDVSRYFDRMRRR